MDTAASRDRMGVGIEVGTGVGVVSTAVGRGSVLRSLEGRESDDSAAAELVGDVHSGWTALDCVVAEL